MSRCLNELCVPLLQYVQPNTKVAKLFSKGEYCGPRLDMTNADEGKRRSRVLASARESPLVQKFILKIDLQGSKHSEKESAFVSHL